MGSCGIGIASPEARVSGSENCDGGYNVIPFQSNGSWNDWRFMQACTAYRSVTGFKYFCRWVDVLY